MYPESSYLENLYLGNLNPNENLNPFDPEFRKLQKQACELENQSNCKLNFLDKDLFQATAQAHVEEMARTKCLYHSCSGVESVGRGAFEDGVKEGSGRLS